MKDWVKIKIDKYLSKVFKFNFKYFDNETITGRHFKQVFHSIDSFKDRVINLSSGRVARDL